MGAPSSAVIAEIFLKHADNLHLEHLAQKHNTINYFRYVDDILLIFDPNHTDIQAILTDFNAKLPKLHLTAETEGNTSLFYTVCLSAPKCFLLNKFAPTGRISMKFDNWVFFKNHHGKLKFYHNMTKTTGPLHDGRYMFLITYSSFLRTEKYFSYFYREITIHSSCSITLLQNLVPFLRFRAIIFYIRTYHRWHYGACALYNGQRKIQMQQNM